MPLTFGSTTGRLLSIDGVHRKIALLELAAEGYEIPEQLPCTYVTAANETEAATIILSVTHSIVTHECSRNDCRV
jgi:hypothetical protein